MSFAEHLLAPHSQEAIDISTNPKIQTQVDAILARIDNL